MNAREAKTLFEKNKENRNKLLVFAAKPVCKQFEEEIRLATKQPTFCVVIPQSNFLDLAHDRCKKLERKGIMITVPQIIWGMEMYWKQEGFTVMNDYHYGKTVISLYLK